MRTHNTGPLVILLLSLLLILSTHWFQLEVEGTQDNPQPPLKPLRHRTRRNLSVRGASSSSNSLEDALRASATSGNSDSEGSSDENSLSQETLAILKKQIDEAKKCFPALYNATIPHVMEQLYFPKNKSGEARFRFHCQESTETKESEVGFLSSYGIDGQYLPEWVAFKIDRAVSGNSIAPGEDYLSCTKKGLNKFFQVQTNDINTPDSNYQDHYNNVLASIGADKRDGIVKGQLCLPTHYLTCKGKAATYAMTNVIPMNRYLYKMNWARGDKGIRDYVASDINPPPPGRELRTLLHSKKYHSVYAVAGTYFSQTTVDKFDWAYNNLLSGEETSAFDFGIQSEIKKAVIPHGVWQAVFDPAKLLSDPADAAIAWYCENRPKGPWPDVGAKETNEATYANGPKLCRVVSLDDLEKLVGVRPFPNLPKEVTSATPTPAVWHLTRVF